MDEQQNQNMPPAGPQIQSGGGDAEKNKPMAIIGYIIPILFFIPLVTDAKNSPFAKFHANQQLNLLLAAIAVNIVGGIIPFLGWFVILPLGSILIIIFAIMGIINAAKGLTKKLPLIGGFNIIK
jgi:uncharacterized membrane protein